MKPIGRGTSKGRQPLATWANVNTALFPLISIDSKRSSILPDVRSRAPETAPLHLKEGETLKLRVFIDRSVVEVFANGRQYAAVRVYPGLDGSVGVSLRSQGQESELISLDAWQMGELLGPLNYRS